MWKLGTQQDCQDRHEDAEKANKRRAKDVKALIADTVTAAWSLPAETALDSASTPASSSSTTSSIGF
jgi:hypothetical protein